MRLRGDGEPGEQWAYGTDAVHVPQVEWEDRAVAELLDARGDLLALVDVDPRPPVGFRSRRDAV